MAKQTLEITIEVMDEALREQLVAALAEEGFDGFLEEDDCLKAYKILANPSDHGENSMHFDILKKYDVPFTTATIEEENWNEAWEKNFESICIDEFVGIRASFHPPIKDVQHELVITPKMSFGTGHHATTFSVIQLMQHINFNGKRVYDFGTGTGILAILAEKLGAQKIVAVDNDPWCIDNANENVLVNDCKAVTVLLSDAAQQNEQYDIVLANINRHIIEANAIALKELLAENGQLVLSGLLETDEADIVSIFSQLGLKYVVTRTKSGWIALHLMRS